MRLNSGNKMSFQSNSNTLRCSHIGNLTVQIGKQNLFFLTLTDTFQYNPNVARY